MVSIVITGLSIAGIANAQLPQAQHFFIVILVLIVFIAVVSAGAYSCRSKSNYNYEVNEDAVKPTKGRENRAFQVTSDERVPPRAENSNTKYEMLEAWR